MLLVRGTATIYCNDLVKHKLKLGKVNRNFHGHPGGGRAGF
jgi:hypothetical protein